MTFPKLCLVVILVEAGSDIESYKLMDTPKLPVHSLRRMLLSDRHCLSRLRPRLLSLQGLVTLSTMMERQNDR